MKTWVRAMTLGTTVCGCILTGTGLGLAADRWLSIRPAGVLCGVVIGTGGALAALWQLTR